jgi:hypothetical protein
VASRAVLPDLHGEMVNQSRSTALNAITLAAIKAAKHGKVTDVTLDDL